jgi:hypothetical protein
MPQNHVNGVNGKANGKAAEAQTGYHNAVACFAQSVC